MRQLVTQVVVIFCALVTRGNALVSSPQKQILDATKIEQLTGLKGKFNPDKSVFKVSQPRTSS